MLTSALGIPWNPRTFTGLTLLLSVILATVCPPWRRNPQTQLTGGLFGITFR
ncbi:MAG: hypothetical protein ACXVGN_07895 [Mycobacteriaceae bacterium]